MDEVISPRISSRGRMRQGDVTAGPLIAVVLSSRPMQHGQQFAATVHSNGPQNSSRGDQVTDISAQEANQAAASGQNPMVWQAETHDAHAEEDLSASCAVKDVKTAEGPAERGESQQGGRWTPAERRRHINPKHTSAHRPPHRTASITHALGKGAALAR